VRFLTDFADQAVMLPLILAVAIMLAAQGWRRGALVWLLVVGTTFLATLAMKLVFLSCSPVFGPWHINSPSGHVAAATVVTGGLAVLLTRRKASILPAAIVAAVAIGISRLVLHMHSFAEVGVGAAIGLCGAAALIRFAGPPPRLQPMPLVAVVAVVALLFHGMHLPAEAAIRHTAYRAAWFIPACRPGAAMPMPAEWSGRGDE
jgi:membrane-associated phospholipid phosphatase